MIDGVLNINGEPIKRDRIAGDCVSDDDVQPVLCYRETLPNGVFFITHYFSRISASWTTRKSTRCRPTTIS